MRTVGVDYDGDGIPDACDSYPADPSGMSDSTATLGSPVTPRLGLQNVTLIEWHLYGSASQGRVAISRPDTILRRDTTYAITRSDTTIGVRRVRYRDYELKDHLGNVRVVVTDMKMSDPGGSPGASPFTADMRSYQNYYPFGMPNPGRVWNGDSARYGYNGKEKDNEVNGSGNEYDYGERIYDARLGRWLSRDILEQNTPGVSTYASFVDNPILFVDPDGREVDLSDLIAAGKRDGIDYAGRLLNELRQLTGIRTLKITDDGKLAYNLGEVYPVVEPGRRSAMTSDRGDYSPTARTALVQAIDASATLNVRRGSRGSRATGPFDVELDPREIDALQDRPIGVDKLTIGWGMVFFHEYRHTIFGYYLTKIEGKGGSYTYRGSSIGLEYLAETTSYYFHPNAERRSKGSQDPVLTFTNDIRREYENATGTPMGERMTYDPSWSDPDIVIMAFNKESLDALGHGKMLPPADDTDGIKARYLIIDAKKWRGGETVKK